MMEIFRQYAMSFVGLQYKWGGDDPIGGLDCSGLIIEIYKSVNLFPPGYDGTAQDIYNKFESASIANSYGLGSLVFYGQSVTKITHIAMMLESTGPWRVLEAGGGGRLTVTKQDAENQNAFVRVRPIDYRKDRVAVLKPLFFSGVQS